MIYNILEEIASTSSRNQKEAILKDNIDNETLKQVIYLAYNPFINFWTKKTPQYKSDKVDQNLEWALVEIRKLSNREITGNAALEFTSDMLSQLSSEDADVIVRVLKKDLRAGFTDGTANKVWPGLIPTYPCMLCAQSDEKVLSKMTYPAYFQMKMDGMRFNAIVQGSKVEYRTRNGKEIELFGILDDCFVQMANGEDIVFDGELLILGDDYKPLPRAIGNGVLQRALKGKARIEDVQNVACVLWDMICLSHFRFGISNDIYKDRFNELKKRASSIKTPRISLVDTHEVISLEQAQQYFKDYLKLGQEGGILKSFTGEWGDKRSRDQIKFKAELEADLLCTAWEAGDEGKKNANRLGRLKLQSSDGLIEVYVGSGFSDEQRDTLAPRDVIGKIISIKYNTRIKDRDSEIESLFLPVFIEVRLDKTTADSAKEIS
jgi:ATP dependent DNA ligase domain/DNA ligase OB-like domain